MMNVSLNYSRYLTIILEKINIKYVVILILGLMLFFSCSKGKFPSCKFSYENKLYIKAEVDKNLNTILCLSKDSVFSRNDTISFDYRARDYIDLYFIPPDTIYVEGDVNVIRNNNAFKVRKISYWPFELNLIHGHGFILNNYYLRIRYISYRDSVLLRQDNRQILKLNIGTLFN